MVDGTPPVLLADPGGNVPQVPPIGPISIGDDDLMQVLGSFIQHVLNGVQVIRGQDNRVPEPLSDHFVKMTPRARRFLSTTTHEEDDPNARIFVARSTACDVLLDFYGADSANDAQAFSTLFRDAYGCMWMLGTSVQPLYCNDGRQMPLVNGEKQYQDRWMVEATLQITPSITIPAQFADTAVATVIKADVSTPG